MRTVCALKKKPLLQTHPVFSQRSLLHCYLQLALGRGTEEREAARTPCGVLHTRTAAPRVQLFAVIMHFPVPADALHPLTERARGTVHPSHCMSLGQCACVRANARVFRQTALIGSCCETLAVLVLERAQIASSCHMTSAL